MALKPDEKAKRFTRMKKILGAIGKIDVQLEELKIKKKDLEKKKTEKIHEVNAIAFDPQQTLELEGEANEQNPEG
jgi:hypothetical protein